MRIQKRTVLLSLIFLAIISAATWILYYKATRKYHRGSFLELLELVPKTQPPRPDTGKQRNESLKKEWKRVAILSKGTEVWKTTTEFMITDASSPKLFCENRELVQQNDVFQKDTPEGSWTWDRNVVWIVVPKNPAVKGCSIAYSPDFNAKTTIQQERLEKS